MTLKKTSLKRNRIEQYKRVHLSVTITFLFFFSTLQQLKSINVTIDTKKTKVLDEKT